jgi:hypothetical protein
MENRWNHTTDPARSDDWRAAQAARHELEFMGKPRVNLLFVGVNGAVERVLEQLQIELHQTVTTRRPGQRLVVPPISPAPTLILHDVGSLEADDQKRLLQWLEVTEGTAQVISTTTTSLLTRVQQREFSDTLYYRLNTVCVDLRD